MRAIYPGSFDPITLGHIDIIERISKLFSEVVVLVANSPEKKSLFQPEQRKEMILDCLSHLKNIRVEIYEGLTVNYARQQGASTIVRGIRAVADFEYEMAMANINRNLDSDVETLIVFAHPKYNFVSSRMAKEVARFGGSLDSLVPKNVIQLLRQKFQNNK